MARLPQKIRIEIAAKQAWEKIQKQEAETYREIVKTYQDAHQDIKQQLANAVSDVSRERLQKLDAFVQSRIDELTPKVNSAVSNSLERGWEIGVEGGLNQSIIYHGAGIVIDWNLFTPRGLEPYSQFALQLCDQYNQELVNKIQQQLRLGFFERKAWNEIMQDIAEKSFGFKRPRSIPLKPKGVLYKIHRIVRTEMQRMRTFGEKEILELDKDITGIHIQFGGGPCPGNVCPPKQGDYFKDGSDKGWPPPDIPFHPNCTCYTWFIYPKERPAAEIPGKAGGGAG